MAQSLLWIVQRKFLKMLRFSMVTSSSDEYSDKLDKSTLSSEKQ